MAHPATRWQTMTDVYGDAGAVNWTSGAFYQVGRAFSNGGDPTGNAAKYVGLMWV